MEENKVPEAYRQFFSKKAFELAYALFRVSAPITHKSFAESLELKALELLDHMTSGEYEKSTHSISAIEYFVRLGAALNLLSPKNTHILIHEIDALNSAIAEYGKNPAIAGLPDISLEGAFSRTSPPRAVGQPGDLPLKNYTMDVSPGKEIEEEEVPNALKIAIRHSAILEKIRQSGNCRIKDIQESLPDVSERTLRYDLQKLAEQGFIERIGSGGPATFYQPKQADVASPSYPQ